MNDPALRDGCRRLKAPKWAWITLLATLTFGCEEPYSPKQPFDDRYIVQCFVEARAEPTATRLSLLLARMYDVDGLNPWTNATDPAVLGAEVILLQEPQQDTLVGRTRLRPDSVRYGAQQPYYTVRSRSPGPSAELTLRIRLPNGASLSAHTTTPRSRGFISSIEFPLGVTSDPRMTRDAKEWSISWDDPRVIEEGHLFFVSLTIPYTRWDDSVETVHSALIPAYYHPATRQPVFPVASTVPSIAISFAALDSAMAAVSSGDPDRNRYGLHNVSVSVIEYDTHFSRYYASLHGSLDQFSIRVSQTAYTNVNGGAGIFASYFVHSATFDLDERYVRSFGYRYR